MQTETVLNFTKVQLDRKKRELQAAGYRQVDKDEDHLLDKEYCTNEKEIPADVGDDFPGHQITWRK